MKKFTILILIILTANLISAQWIQQELSPSFPLKNVIFTNNNDGWVWSDFGPYETTDGGTEWHFCNGIFTDMESNMFITDSYHGWIYGSTGIWNTNDANLGCESSWDLQNESIANDGISPIFFLDSMIGWAIMHWESSDVEWSEIYHTTNSGGDWSENQGIPGRVIRDVIFVSSDIGWAIDEETSGQSYASGLIYTSDGGENWNSINNSIGGSSLHFTDTQNGWIIGVNENAGIWHTNDGGNTLIKQVGDTVPVLHDLFFIDELIGWAVGDEGSILHTSDGGNTWEYQESGTLANLNSICFADYNYGWICGDSGIILHNDGIVSIDEVQQNQNKLYIFPNPTTGKANINFEFEEKKEVTLVVQNITGQEIKHILLGNKITGDYELNCTEFSKGIYFITLKTNSGILTDKLIIE